MRKQQKKDQNISNLFNLVLILTNGTKISCATDNCAALCNGLVGGGGWLGVGWLGVGWGGGKVFRYFIFITQDKATI